MPQSSRVKVSIPPNTLFFLQRRAQVYGLTLPAYIRKLVFRDIQTQIPPAIRRVISKAEKNSPDPELATNRPMTNREFFASLEALRQ